MEIFVLQNTTVIFLEQSLIETQALLVQNRHGDNFFAVFPHFYSKYWLQKRNLIQFWSDKKKVFREAIWMPSFKNMHFTHSYNILKHAKEEHSHSNFCLLKQMNVNIILYLTLNCLFCFSFLMNVFFLNFESVPTTFIDAVTPG